jgi:hypothetical protein
MPSRPAPATDSPLFWLLLFGSVGLVMLTAIEPKFAKRQQRIERMQQSREHGRPVGDEAAEAGEGGADGGKTPFWQATHTATLRPLMLFLAAVLVGGIVAMQIRRQKLLTEYRRAVAAENQGGAA